MKQTEHSDLTEDQRALLSYLRHRLQIHDGLVAWLTVGDLMRAQVVYRATAGGMARMLGELVARGLVESRRMPYRGKLAPLQYRAKVEAGGKANG